MKISIAVCLITLIALALWLRRRTSLGLPIAYMGNLLLLHIPGAIAQNVADDRTGLTPIEFTRTGIILTAVGSIAFVFGVVIAQMRQAPVTPAPAPRSAYWRFCVLAGGITTVIGYLIHIPSIGAVLSRGGAIWMLGVMLGLRRSLERGDKARAARWIAVLAAYPILMLLLGGFLSYGAMAVIIVLSGLIVTVRSQLRIAIVSLILLVAGMSLFLSSFEHRPEIRAAVWGGGDTEARIDATVAALQDVKPLNPRDQAQLYAFDQRLNQNYFVGLAASRISSGAVGYLYGRSIVEGLQALVPRALWPDKPVMSGSPKIVSEMTGLKLSEGTSFGVGNVMEFDINFGIPGLIAGFVLLGWVLGKLDRRAAESDLRGDLGQAFITFLPAVALIQPNGSVVDMMGGAAAGLVAGFGWRWAWRRWPKSVRTRLAPIGSASERAAI
jgi:hypothetical protein